MTIKAKWIICGAIGAGFAGLIAFGASESNKIARAKRADNLTDAQKCIAVYSSDIIKGTTSHCDNVRTDWLSAEVIEKFKDALVKHKKVQADKEARRKEEDRAREEAIAKREQKRQAEIAAEQKAFRDAGWWEQAPGIFVRWCTRGPNKCSSGGVIGDSSYALMEVWCKERACGDIYAQVNLMDSSQVVGWTNDTGFGDRGAKVTLTFDSYRDDWNQAELVKFRARGSW